MHGFVLTESRGAHWALLVSCDADLVPTATIDAPAWFTQPWTKTRAGDLCALSVRGASNYGRGDASECKQRCDGNYEAHGRLWCRLKE